MKGTTAEHSGKARLSKWLTDCAPGSVSADKAMLVWNPNGDVALVSWPDYSHLSSIYERSTLGCYKHFCEMGTKDRTAFIFIELAHLIIRDGVDPAKAHRALLPLIEYVDGLAGDVPVPGPEKHAAGVRVRWSRDRVPY